MIKVSTTGMAVSLKTDLRFPESGQHGHGSRIIQNPMKTLETRDSCNRELIFIELHVLIKKKWLVSELTILFEKISVEFVCVNRNKICIAFS